MATESELSAAREAVRRNDRRLLGMRGVNGVGVGLKIVNGSLTDLVCARIYVTRKLPGDDLPEFLDAGDGVSVVTDIVEGGPFRRHDHPTPIPPRTTWVEHLRREERCARRDRHVRCLSRRRFDQSIPHTQQQPCAGSRQPESHWHEHPAAGKGPHRHLSGLHDRHVVAICTVAAGRQCR